jgi:Short C-terminal domain
MSARLNEVRRPAKLPAMECVCGCGRDLPGKLHQRNFLAANVALELLVWDRNRASPAPGPEGREGLIARGADCYGRLLHSLHGEGGADPDQDCNAWLNESAEMRAGRSDMNTRRLLGNGAPNLSKADLAQLDRRHPELSFTGRTGEDTDKLERLRTLHDDGVLTDEEFAAAKARLLGRD